MGVLTESMTRLRDEILALRDERSIFRSELARSTKLAQLRVSRLRMAIAADLAGARRAWCGSNAAERPMRAIPGLDRRQRPGTETVLRAGLVPAQGPAKINTPASTAAPPAGRPSANRALSKKRKKR